MARPPEFVCGHCHKLYRRESSFLQHECDKMRRASAMATVKGQTAFMCYQTWMSLLKRSRPVLETFMDSNLFWQFIKFVEFTRKASVTNTERYIQLMVDLGFQPNMWTMDEVYALFIDYLDKRCDPLVQLNDSVTTLLRIADAADIDVGDVFDILEPHEITHLVRVRHLSPWLLLHSKKFKKYFRDNMNIEQRVALEVLINPETWIQRFESRGDVVEISKEYLAEMGL